MKKIVFLMLVLVSLLILVACTEPTVTTQGNTSTSAPAGTTSSITTKPITTTPATTAADTTPAVTTAITPPATTTITTTVAPVTSTSVSTTAPTTSTVPSAPVTEKTESYTAILNQDVWTPSEDVSSSEYEFFGPGSTVAAEIAKNYNEVTRVWYVLKADGTREKSTYAKVRNLGMIGASAKKTDDSTVEITVKEVPLSVQSSWTSVTARAGSYLMFDFKTSLPVDYTVTVTKKEGDKPGSALYTEKSITITQGADGIYTGIAKCTVPYIEGQTFYINIGINEGKQVLASIPVTVTASKYDSPYQLIFQGDWDIIRHEDYLDNLVELFYNVYPRLYKRWGNGTEPKVITFMADKNYDGVAYCAGTLVCVATDYANSNPDDIGFFAHEITHSVQQFDKMYYGDGAWFTEAMADLGRFRYFHWGYDTDYIRYYSDNEALNFKWEPYSQHNMFMVWLDWKYPTTKNADGSLKLGLMDYIVSNEKAWTGGTINDNPYTVGSVFNNWVKDITGVETMDQLRLQFIEEYKDGTFTFIGFRDYVDNFLTEDVPGIANPVYPMEEEIKPSAETHDKLQTPITEGENLALGGTFSYLTTNGTAKYPQENLLDGDLTTRFEAPQNAGVYKLNKIQNEYVIDLGSVKSFNTYTFVNAGVDMSTMFNTKEWEILLSTDGKTFTAVDYQDGNKDSIVSVNIGDQSARYIKIRLFDSGSAGRTRLYEFMLFDIK